MDIFRSLSRYRESILFLTFLIAAAALSIAIYNLVTDKKSDEEDTPSEPGIVEQSNEFESEGVKHDDEENGHTVLLKDTEENATLRLHSTVEGKAADIVFDVGTNKQYVVNVNGDRRFAILSKDDLATDGELDGEADRVFEIDGDKAVRVFGEFYPTQVADDPVSGCTDANHGAAVFSNGTAMGLYLCIGDGAEAGEWKKLAFVEAEET